MEADDDGFVSNMMQLMKMLGSSSDDFQLLLTKRFVMPFTNGLMLIKHWRVHNYIQNDRYTPTTFTDERESVKVKDNGVYSLDEGIPMNDVVVSMLYPQVRLGKDRLGKTTKRRSPKEIEALTAQFEEFWSQYPKKVGKKPCLNWWIRKNITKEVAQQIIVSIEQHKQSETWRKGFVPNPQTFLNQGRYEDEVEVTNKTAEYKSYK